MANAEDSQAHMIKIPEVSKIFYEDSFKWIAEQLIFSFKTN